MESALSLIKVQLAFSTQKDGGSDSDVFIMLISSFPWKKTLTHWDWYGDRNLAH